MTSTTSRTARRGDRRRTRTIDPVTFEILRNSFSNAVELMAQQFRLTCHSFVIYAKDFSCSLADAEGNPVAQGDQDIAVHIGTHHLVCRSVIDAFAGDIHPGDVFVTNDPYSGGTHFNDVRVLRPIFVEGELIAWAMANGHWSDVGGLVPGSFDVKAREHFGEGLRIPPIRVWSAGELHDDIAAFIVGNTRAPQDNLSDLHAQAEATRVCEREVLRLVGRYGRDVVTAAFGAVIDHASSLLRARVAALPDGTWTAVDYLDGNPALGEGLVPVQVTLTIDGDRLRYDLNGSGPAVSTFMNSTYGATLSGLLAGTKHFFPDVPVNAGLYRAIEVDLGPEGTVVNAAWPTAVSGFVSGVFEKVVNALFELWSQIIPARAMSCSFNLEYLLIGGRDMRSPEQPIFMWYDWMVGGWGGRNGRDGATAASPLFGAGFASQPVEGQERLNPIITSHHRIVPDSGGPGRFRGGCGVEKGGQLSDSAATVMSYCCDRERSVPWGLEGGLPSSPQGLRLNPEAADERYLGAIFSNEELIAGDRFSRASAGGGGYGDPLDRSADAVLDDVIDGYVTPARAAKDYGVVVMQVQELPPLWEVDDAATEQLRGRIRRERHGWLDMDAFAIARRYRDGDLDALDCLRQYGVVLDWGTGELLPRTTQQMRDLLRRRAAQHWRTSAEEAS
jgi:N-methylhydantoinase B